MTSYEEYEKLKDQVKEYKLEIKRLKAENEVARALINSYYKEGKHDVNNYLKERKEAELSDGAKKFIKDIAEGRIWESLKNGLRFWFYH